MKIRAAFFTALFLFISGFAQGTAERKNAILGTWTRSHHAEIRSLEFRADGTFAEVRQPLSRHGCLARPLHYKGNYKIHGERISVTFAGEMPGASQNEEWRIESVDDLRLKLAGDAGGAFYNPANYRKKLLGRWAKKTAGGDAVLEFRPDGAFAQTVPGRGGPAVYTGTFFVHGNRFTVNYADKGPNGAGGFCRLIDGLTESSLRFRGGGGPYMKIK